ncbi:hypothetical protein K501DRAFT_280612, partial [Backusella circina FSU 941]
AKEQVAAASKPNLPLHILTFDDYTYNILGDRDRERSAETADKKRPLIEKTRSTTPERKKSRKTTGGKVVPPRPPTRELEEGETISPSPSPNVKRVREDEVSESRKKRPTSPRRSRSPRRASSPRRPRSPSRKARSDKSVSRSKTERRRSSLTRVEGTRKKYEHRDRDASVDSKSSSKKRRQKKGDELEDVFASAAALDQKRNNEQKEEKAKEERIKEEKMREEKLKEEKFKEEKLKEEKLKEEKLKEEKLKEEKLVITLKKNEQYWSMKYNKNRCMSRFSVKRRYRRTNSTQHIPHFPMLPLCHCGRSGGFHYGLEFSGSYVWKDLQRPMLLTSLRVKSWKSLSA